MRGNNDWLDYLDASRNDILEHSAKGTEWGNHKYIAKIGNRYFYSQEQLSAFKKTKSARTAYESAQSSGASKKEVAKLKKQYDSQKQSYLNLRSQNKSGVLGAKAYAAKAARQKQHVLDVKTAQTKNAKTQQKLQSTINKLKEARSSGASKEERQALKKKVSKLENKADKTFQNYMNQTSKHQKVQANVAKNYSQEENLALTRGDVTFEELAAARKQGSGAVTKLLTKRDKKATKAYGKAARNS